MSILSKLFNMQDSEYKEFHSKLIPNIDPESIIGIRIPELRRLAKEIKNSSEANDFINTLPHRYYEENNLHVFLICEINDYDSCVDKLNAFLPYVDNWATCDSIRPKVFKRNKDKLLADIIIWIKSKDVYTVRFAIEMLMTHYLDEAFKSEYLDVVLNVKSNEYYINMMIAWYFATALAKQWDSTIHIIKKGLLPPWTHNKTIQKAVESYRIDDKQKVYLKSLKINTTD